jgi:uncharacterized protein with GYD domain
MPTFFMIGRHTAENCPMLNEKSRKVALEWFSKRDGLLNKHGIKSLGSWTAMGEHLTLVVYEAPSSDAIMKLFSEPEMMAFNAIETMEVKMAISNEEVAKMLKQAK